MTDRVHTSQRIIILGGGVSGLSIAVRLAQAGMPVTVLEAGRIGTGATTRNQGWLHSGGWFAPVQPELARLCYESLEQTRRFCPNCREPEHDSMVYAVADPETRAELWTEAWEAAEIPYEELPREDLARRLPELDVGEIRKSFQLPDLSIRFDVLLEHLARSAESAGVEIRTGTRVSELMRSRDSVQGVITEDGEEVTARLVILAGNAAGLFLYPRPAESSVADQIAHRVVALKTHLVAVEQEVGKWPLCVVDVNGFNQMPHPPSSVFGTNRWFPTEDPTDEDVETAEIERIWQDIGRFFPRLDRRQQRVIEWAGTTLQAIQTGVLDPAITPLPTIVDHTRDEPATKNLLSVFAGRATLWAPLAEQTQQVVLDKLAAPSRSVAGPPWGHVSTPPEEALPRAVQELRSVAIYHCQKCGNIVYRQLGLRPPVCCGQEMTKAAEKTVRQ